MAESIPDAELAAMEQRCVLAGPGPWRVDIPSGQSVQGPVGAVTAFPMRQEVAAFVAAARQDIPRLIAEIRRLRGTPGA